MAVNKSANSAAAVAAAAVVTVADTLHYPADMND